MPSRVTRSFLCLCTVLATTVVGAQQPEPMWPGAKYDPAIPTLLQVLGHDTGLEITPPDQVADYLQALAKAAPTRTRLFEYARTWENRPLWLMVIGSRLSSPGCRMASMGTRFRRAMPRCSKRTTCWRRRAIATWTRCCASRWC